MTAASEETARMYQLYEKYRSTYLVGAIMCIPRKRVSRELREANQKGVLIYPLPARSILDPFCVEGHILPLTGLRFCRLCPCVKCKAETDGRSQLCADCRRKYKPRGSSSEVASLRESHSQILSVSRLIQILENRGYTVRDNSETSGALWVKGDVNFGYKLTEFESLGFRFQFVGGGAKVFKGDPAWYVMVNRRPKT